MKIKSQLIIFNLITRLLVILVFWLVLPILVQKVVYKKIDKSLVEKKQKFLEHLDKEEINDFILRNDTTETYASFSTLHSEFLQLSRKPTDFHQNKTVFVDEYRIIEGEQDNYRILRYQFLYEKTAYELEIGNSLGEIQDLTFIIKLFVLVVLIIILVVTFVMDTFYIEYLLKPFYKIIDTKIRRVNEPDTFDHTPINSTSSDFRELDTVLNQMMNRISELFKMEKQFIANVSHELLTPIALLQNKFENLIQNESLNDNAVDKIASSLRTLDMLKKVINNLLLISRIENHQYESNEKVNLQELLDDLCEDLTDRIDEKKIDLKMNLQHQFEFIGNKTLIHILLYNLMVNAIKYNKENGSIVVTDGFDETDYFLSISDTGIGMNENQVSHIFNRFTRINANEDGNGLGLAIVRSIALFHQIKIEVNSKLGEGTIFLLHFPVKENFY
ncbi:HAMP domain-containing histidine kinase [Flavobacterium sufflavum]|uniref:histidine kinase n=1 Tax=Flavobacterium sufflavum TaxID=1921138 RepID=A0A437L0H5_9FLAO|nr:HAMP domain-containing sensor histidine kinase [Flavobacterium sufflavum]RVT78478.1 HAMP domain-containing histidine kinase [Flavobacterium sufflavum]